MRIYSAEQQHHALRLAQLRADLATANANREAEQAAYLRQLSALQMALATVTAERDTARVNRTMAAKHYTELELALSTERAAHELEKAKVIEANEDLLMAQKALAAAEARVKELEEMAAELSGMVRGG